MSDQDQGSPTDPSQRQPPAESKTFTGYRRSRKTHWSIAFMDILARIVITAWWYWYHYRRWLDVPVFSWVVIHSFSLRIKKRFQLKSEAGSLKWARRFMCPSMNTTSWAGPPLNDGQVVKFRIDNGEILDRVSLAEEGEKLTAWSFPQRGNMAIFGYDDGRIRRAEMSFSLDFMQLEDAPEALRNLKEGEIATYGNKLAQMTPKIKFVWLVCRLTCLNMSTPKSPIPVVRV